MFRIIFIITIVVAGLSLAILLLIRLTGQNQNPAEQAITERKVSLYAKQLQSDRDCRGEGEIEFTHPPMKPTDISVILPYGLLADAHVTPIDHMYFSPKDFKSAPDTYPVYAIADGTIATIGFRKGFVGDSTGPQINKKGDYRLDVEYTCTFYSYYDLITSLAPEIASQVNTDQSQSWHERKRIPIKAGQEIGRIGGQTLDWAVYNTEIILPGLLVPEHYDREPWKIHTDYKALDYFVEPIRTNLYQLLARQVEPRIGKIDYDIDSKIIGNWFREGTNGYAGTDQMRYWDGHLAIVYDYIDPTQLRFSIGSYQGKAAQFGIKNNAPDPANIGIGSEKIKYELTRYTYLDGDTGQPWRSNEGPIANPRSQITGEVLATALVQLIEAKKLKVEIFVDKTADQVTDFTDQALFYKR